MMIKPERCYQGISVAPGIVKGKVFLYIASEEEIPCRKIEEQEIAAEMKRFKAAISATQQELLKIQQRVEMLVGAPNARLFDAPLLVLEDPSLLKDVLESLQRDRFNIEYILNVIVKRSCHRLKNAENAYLRERTLDIEDVSRRILHHLSGKPKKKLSEPVCDKVFIANMVTASDAAMLHHDRIIGLATELGSKTSHTAIIARALGIPVIVGLHHIVSELEEGDNVLLDGYTGKLIINPTSKTLRTYDEIKTQQQYLDVDLEDIRETSSITLDKRRVILSANVELLSETESIVKSGAEGIGLYRTELLYLNRSEAPTEEEQFKIFRNIAQKIKPQNIIIRTFDIGADKAVDFLQLEVEQNPALGCRGIRFALKHKDLFKVQLRALLRASVEGNLKIMYPMISGISELKEANLLLEEAKKELSEEGLAFYENIEVGIMIEVPSAAMISDLLAKEVKFFSIGTNDLIQYMIAADRGSETIAERHYPAHTGIIRILKLIIDAAHEAGIWVGVCGELAGDILFAPLLIGLGVDELSASAILIPRIKKAIQSLDYSSCKELVSQVIQGESAEENYRRCLLLAEKRYGMLLTADQRE